MNELVYKSVGNVESLSYYWPELSLIGVFLVVFFVDLATGRKRSSISGPIGLVGLIAAQAMPVALAVPPSPQPNE